MKLKFDSYLRAVAGADADDLAEAELHGQLLASRREPVSLQPRLRRERQQQKQQAGMGMGMGMSRNVALLTPYVTQAPLLLALQCQ